MILRSVTVNQAPADISIIGPEKYLPIILKPAANMNQDNYDYTEGVPVQQHHVHYHYHYYGSEGGMEESRVSNYSHHEPMESPKFIRNREPGASSRLTRSSLNEWKSKLNPEVNKMYHRYGFNESRFSENNPQISEEDEQCESPSPLKSEVLHSAYYGHSRNPQTPLGKLDQLYQQTRLRATSPRDESKSQITRITTASDLETQDKMLHYQKQLKRLRRYEQECIYLRDRFYRHVLRRHPEELEK